MQTKCFLSIFPVADTWVVEKRQQKQSSFCLAGPGWPNPPAQQQRHCCDLPAPLAAAAAGVSLMQQQTECRSPPG